MTTSIIARRLPFGAELVAPEPHALSPLGAVAASSVAVVDRRRAATSRCSRRRRLVRGRASTCGAGTRYRYRVEPPDGGEPLLVPDPASRAQDGDVHDPSIVVDPEAFAGRTTNGAAGRGARPSSTNCTPASPAASTASQRMLPRLAALGVTAIELMPIADFPGPRNWGYDGVLPFAPDATYGTPDELKALIDAAHGLGLMVFLDVVYNHFGPDGNYIGALRRRVLPRRHQDAVGPRDRLPPAARCATSSATTRSTGCEEFRFDGLRLDATHSIVPQDWLEELAGVRARRRSTRRATSTSCSSTKATRRTCSDPTRHLGGYDAQWNDDAHHVLHVLLTGETDGYYVDFADEPADKLARCLSEGFVYQGQPSTFRKGAPRGEPSKDLPPTAFVLVPAEPRPDRQPRIRRAPRDAGAIRRRSRPRSRCCCCRRRSRCSSWARKSAPRSRSCSSRAIRRRARRGGPRRPARRVRRRASASPIPRCATRSPTRTHPDTFERSRIELRVRRRRAAPRPPSRRPRARGRHLITLRRDAHRAAARRARVRSAPRRSARRRSSRAGTWATARC